jgi:hypothetical protein
MHTGIVWAQAGRLPPIPHIPGGGGVPHIPVHFFGHDSDLGDVLLVILGVGVAVVILVAIGYNLGWAVGRGKKRSGGAANPAPPEVPSGPVERDLILNPLDVADKAGQTTLLMEFLARHDSLLNPATLRPAVSATFCLVQQCWEARDYGPVSDLLCPGILGQHLGMLRELRRRGEINRIEGLRVDAVDFVHLHCPDDPGGREFTALITFEAAAYFVNDRDGNYKHGSRGPRQFQEFWVFRCQDDRWLLRAIERTHNSDRLNAANEVAGLSAEQLENVQHSIAL